MMNYSLVKKMYLRGGLVRKIVLKSILKKEGGPFKSNTLRRLLLDTKGIEAGIGSYGWQNDYFDGPAIIGKYTSIGPGVQRICVDHYMEGVSSHPCYFNPSYGWVDNDFREKTKISVGNDVWIGSNAIILPGVTEIGNGAVVAAGAVVTKNVPPYAIVAGVPAKVLKMRFSEDLIQRLQECKWWDYPEATLKQMVDLFKEPEIFLEQLEKKKRNGD